MPDFLTRCALLAALAGSGTVALAADGPVDDWPHWRGPTRDGIAPCTAWASKGKDAPLWKKNVGLGYSNVCIADGRLLTLGFDEATERDVLICLDPLTGAEHWRYDYPSKLWDNMHAGGTLTTPVSDGTNVYLLSRLGTINCVTLADGSLVWKRNLAEEESLTVDPFGIPSSPLLTDGGLLLNVGKTMLLDRATGATKWETKDYGYSYSVPVEAVVANKPSVVVFNGAGLVILDRLSGAETSLFPWTSRYNVNCASPIIIGDRVFISTGYNALGCAMLDLSSGTPEVAWQSKDMNNKMTGCVLFKGHLYGFDEAILRCLDLDGEKKWHERGLGTGALLASADGRLVVLSEDGELIVANATPTRFDEQSRTRIFEDGKCWTTPVLSGGLIFCRNSLGELVCLDHRPATAPANVSP